MLNITKRVYVKLNGGPIEAEVKLMPRHKKNPDVGQKETVYTSEIFIEQEDALSFEDQEEVRKKHHESRQASNTNFFIRSL